MSGWATPYLTVGLLPHSTGAYYASVFAVLEKSDMRSFRVKD